MNFHLQRINFFFFFIALVSLSSCQEGYEYTNHLIDESSPYLLQHAHNPVDWYPWSEEALTKAKEENKMLIISVGYAACHWCHVMEHESFEDTTVARIMNEHFVSIKVDREERPDVDDVYMTACQMSTGEACGWPLNAFALPDGRPVWAGTYFPKKQWLEILRYFQQLNEQNPGRIETFATQLLNGLRSRDIMTLEDSDSILNQDSYQKLADNLLSNVDFREGGSKGAPKFPMPTNMDFLLDYHYRAQDLDALEAVNKTLTKMAYGGIYDQLGGGFARYSTDAIWKVPHFEKMLYDNSQLISLYAKAYRQSKDELYKTTIEETIEFVERELGDPSGGFYSSLDADSEGEEGKYYVWEMEAVERILNDEREVEVISAYYNLSKRGNWEDGKNILHRKKSISEVAGELDLEEAAFQELLEGAKKKLFKARQKRVRPGLDNKILTSWNGLMLQAYVDAYKALGNTSYRRKGLTEC